MNVGCDACCVTTSYRNAESGTLPLHAAFNIHTHGTLPRACSRCVLAPIVRYRAGAGWRLHGASVLVRVKFPWSVLASFCCVMVAWRGLECTCMFHARSRAPGLRSLCNQLRYIHYRICRCPYRMRPGVALQRALKGLPLSVSSLPGALKCRNDRPTLFCADSTQTQAPGTRTREVLTRTRHHSASLDSFHTGQLHVCLTAGFPSVRFQYPSPVTWATGRVPASPGSLEHGLPFPLHRQELPCSNWFVLVLRDISARWQKKKP